MFANDQQRKRYSGWGEWSYRIGKNGKRGSVSLVPQGNYREDEAFARHLVRIANNMTRLPRETIVVPSYLSIG